MKVHANQSKRRRDQRGRRFTVRTKSLAVKKQFSVKLSRSPTLQHRSHRRLVDAEQGRNRLQVRTQRDNRTHVQIAIGPTVEALTDAGCKLVVDRRVTQRTRDADSLQAAVVVE